jgi:hypothetical protein
MTGSFRLGFAAVCVAALASAGAAAQNRLVHTTGQTVTPAFEGWFKNPDGSYSLVFGYYNRNKGLEVDVPVGPNNKLAPGSLDRGQPTHFLPGRQVGVFALTVPKDFGTQAVTWTLTTQGQTLAIPGYIRPDFEISAMKELTTGNMPPAIRLDRDATPIQGPAGGTISRRAAVGERLGLTVWADPAPTGETEADAEAIAADRILTITRYRGSDTLTLDKSPLKFGSGNEISTGVTFTERGDYILRIVAGRPATTGCCWTNAFLKVVVQ